MKKKSFEFITLRNSEKAPYWELLYEWEDELSKNLAIPINHIGNFKYLLYKLLSHIKFTEKIQFLLRRKRNTISFFFKMIADDKFHLLDKRNSIPIIVDFYISDYEYESFLLKTKQYKAIGVTSIEAYHFLLNKKHPSTIFHLPVSLPDKYKLVENANFVKKYDILLIGRINSVLEKYLHEYSSIHPEIEYVYSKVEDRVYNYYSNKTGILNFSDNRLDYFKLIQEARIAFYSSPGIDNCFKKTNGYHQVTPRLFELLSGGCCIIARYPENEESNFFELHEICKNVDSYKQFEELINNYLNSSTPFIKNIKYLENHYTSKNSNILKEIMERLQQ